MRYLFACLSLLFIAPLHAADRANAPVSWSYDNDYTGQDEWGLLTPAFAACGIGTGQSPVHIANTKPVQKPAPVFDYKTANADVRHAGFTVETRIEGEQAYVEDNTRYTLRYIHLHSPSEHIAKDVFYPLEIQLMHENAEGKKLILAVFAQIGAPLDKLDALLDATPKNQGDAPVSITFNPAWLLPEYGGHYAYTGSLTTPPCTEGIEWRVMKKTISISKPQLSKLTKHIGRNARLTQPIYMRTIEEIVR